MALMRHLPFWKIFRQKGTDVFGTELFGGTSASPGAMPMAAEKAFSE
jgi:hypothetical protein